MQVTNHSNNKRNMKEELLEAIYGTVERLEQKVDELSASPKNTEAESTPVSVSVDTSKLEKAILSVSARANSIQQYEQGLHKNELSPSMSESNKDPWNGISSIGLFAPSNVQTYEPFPEDESAKKKKKKRRRGFSL